MTTVQPSVAPHPAGPAAAADPVAHLLEFLRDRDVPCPLCGYNLRNLTRPECPECRQDLSLTVGVERPRIDLLIATITPCTFSGIAAALLLIPITLSLIMGGGPPPWFVYATDGFGWLSGLAALVLLKRRFAFIRLPRRTQILCAAATWAVHVAAFIALMWLTL